MRRYELKEYNANGDAIWCNAHSGREFKLTATRSGFEIHTISDVEFTALDAVQLAMKLPHGVTAFEITNKSLQALQGLTQGLD